MPKRTVAIADLLKEHEATRKEETLDGDFIGERLDYILNCLEDYGRKTPLTLAIETLVCDISTHIAATPHELNATQEEYDRLREHAEKHPLMVDSDNDREIEY